jgi:iron transport multicopper oxidase
VDPTDLLSVIVAQSYSVLVTARNDAPSNWAIHANMDTIKFLVCRIHSMAQPRVTKTIDLEVIFDTMDDGNNYEMFNQVMFDFPVVPSVLSALTLGANATVAEAYGPLSFVIEYGNVVDLVVKDGAVGKHPL